MKKTKMTGFCQKNFFVIEVLIGSGFSNSPDSDAVNPDLKHWYDSYLCTNDLYIMFWVRADPLRGQVGEGWAREIKTFLGPVNMASSH
jgi:hypothetical protein